MARGGAALARAIGERAMANPSAGGVQSIGNAAADEIVVTANLPQRWAGSRTSAMGISLGLYSLEERIDLDVQEGRRSPVQAAQARIMALAYKQSLADAASAGLPTGRTAARVDAEGRPYLITDQSGDFALTQGTLTGWTQGYMARFDAGLNAPDGKAEFLDAIAYNRDLVRQWDAQAYAAIDGSIGGFVAAGVLGAASLSTAPISASLYGHGSTGFYFASVGAGASLGVTTEYAKNSLLGDEGTVGGYVSAAAFGGLAGTGVSFIASEAQYVASLSRFSGVSAERIAAAGNGFVFGFGADFAKQVINVGAGEQNRIDPLSLVTSGSFGSVGGAALPRYYGIGAEEQLNIATYRAIWNTRGRTPVGATPWLTFRAAGEAQMPVTIGQSVITPTVEVGAKKTYRALGY